MKTVVRNEDGVGPVLQRLSFFIVVVILSAGLYFLLSAPTAEISQPPAETKAQSLSISTETAASVTDSSLITVTAYDANNNPVSGENAALYYSIPSSRESWSLPVQLSDQGDGKYTTSFSSQWAGKYYFTAWVGGTEIRETKELVFESGPPVEVVIDSTSPKPGSSYYTSALTFYFLDQYGNVVPSDRVTPQVETTFGLVGQTSELHAIGGVFGVSIDADNWGAAQVSVSDNSTGISASTQIEFSPLYLDLSYNLVDPTVEFISYENLEFMSSGDNQSFIFDVGVFFPPELGTLGQYDLRVEFDNSLLEVVSVADPDLTDNFQVAEWSVTDNVIRLTQSGQTTSSGVGVAKVLFNVVDWIDNVWEGLKEKTGKIITWVENLWDNLTTPAPTPPGTVVTNGKVFKKLFVPIKFWVAPGADVSDEDLRERAEKAENIYNKNAIACRLKYWYVFLVEINHISDGDWNAHAPNDNVTWGDVDNSTAENLAKAIGWDRWVNVYVVPENGLQYHERSCTWVADLGWWVDNGRIFYDPKLDPDNLTFPHELIHELSKSNVKDSPHENARDQGGRDENNIMNYDNTGETISENQGKLIDEQTENNSEERPENEGGGRIYRPRLGLATVTPAANKMHVSNIQTGFEHFTGYSYAKAWVIIMDDQNSVVSGATVTVQVSRPDDTTATEAATTGADGTALISHYTTYYGSYFFDVTNVQLEGKEYDSAANVASSASVTLA